MALSEKDKQVYEFLKQRISEGFVPTVREICHECGFKSTSTAHRAIAKLVDAGLIEKQGDNLNRAIRLKGDESIRVPILGTVTAGQPITAIEQVEGFLGFRPTRHYDGELFALKVRGESMINAAILDGDTVIIEQTPVAENGEIVVALTADGEATVKRFYRENGHYRLQPENDTMEPIILDEVSIVGKVVAVLRYID